MKALAIRRYDAQSSALKLFFRYLEMQYQPVQITTPPPGAVLARATAQLTGVELLVDVRAWFGKSLPEKSGLRADLISPDEIRDLFHYSGAALTLQLPGEAEEPLTISSLVAADDYRDKAMPIVNTSCGPGWLTAVNAHYRSHISQALPSLLHGMIPFRLDFMLGSSALSYRHLKKLQRGDVLLVNQLLETVLTGDRTLAKYRQQEDYLMLEDIYDEQEEHEQYTPLHKHQELQPQLMGINNIPVQLTFIINQMTLTLDELAVLHIGDVIATGTGGENSITICANGALLAKGELVMVDERLGVEIQTLCYEAHYGK
ncbi:type III secretion system cytoplasmic ring protein SctQ [Winslowiella iniecta]|uniref:Surface presentation of antigens protein SpaO n=1 Tax=Winslowiella iniecta TaxID=1560201 RepID=A0A0L7TGG3_9GAMM|nr:type III secretion system cytoplasmic ring protein SctQ [Winslowiella iniecta]KOC91602.1 hypothetical protein NG42_05020 [Winslowiella iniecta]KOC94447.1 hypothetical protein NG43_04485 [Winslowiella iniecta]